MAWPSITGPPRSTPSLTHSLPGESPRKTALGALSKCEDLLRELDLLHPGPTAAAHPLACPDPDQTGVTKVHSFGSGLAGQCTPERRASPPPCRPGTKNAFGCTKRTTRYRKFPQKEIDDALKLVRTAGGKPAAARSLATEMRRSGTTSGIDPAAFALGRQAVGAAIDLAQVSPMRARAVLAECGLDL